MEWTNDTCLKLIDEYKKHPELWNKHHLYYYCQSRKRAAWEYISKRIGCQVKEARRKMEILQVSLRRERSKLRKRAASQPNYEPRWFAYQRMNFLARNRNSDGTIVTNIRQDNQEHLPDAVIHEINANLFPENVSEASILNEVKVEEVELSLDSRRSLEKAVQTNLENQSTNDAVNDDDSSVFGEFVVKKLHGYNRKVKCIVQYNINKILFQADMGCYDDGTYSTHELSELARFSVMS